MSGGVDRLFVGGLGGCAGLGCAAWCGVVWALLGPGQPTLAVRCGTVPGIQYEACASNVGCVATKLLDT